MTTKDKSIGAAFCDAMADISTAKRVGIICAMESEVKDLVDKLKGASVEEIYGYKFYEGVLEKTPVVLLQCGVGKVNAARGTQLMIDRYRPTVIVNSGAAGGVAEGLNVGDVIVATEFVHHDFDATALGYAKGYTCNGIDPDKPTIFNADTTVSDRLVEAAESATNRMGDGRHVRIGRIASGDFFVGTVEKKAEIRKQFNAVAAEMEGAAIAQTAQYAGIPYGALRVVSDLADGSNSGSYDEFETKAAVASANILCDYVAKALQD